MAVRLKDKSQTETSFWPSRLGIKHKANNLVLVKDGITQRVTRRFLLFKNFNDGHKNYWHEKGNF